MANMTLKSLTHVKDGLVSGHRMCAGCGPAIIVRQIMKIANALVEPVVVCATGCLEVATTIFPDTAWNVPFMHNAFENAGATASGVEAALRALKKKGKLNTDKRVKVIAFGGDGGTYDIGLQSLSGAMERGHDMIYICYNNEAYMNTGIQRSGATPKWAATTTSPAGKKIPGKPQRRKDLTSIMVAHDLPYVAQIAIGDMKYFNTLKNVITKAIEIEGPVFINVLAPCPTGWYHATDKAVELSMLAVETGVWPMYEVENGEYRLLPQTPKPDKKKPVDEYLKLQGRYKHVLKNEELLRQVQEEVDDKYFQILKKCGIEV